MRSRDRQFIVGAEFRSDGSVDTSRAAIMDDDPKSKSVVGAVAREDGSFDTSRAAVMLEDNDSGIERAVQPEQSEDGQLYDRRTFINPIESPGKDGGQTGSRSESEVIIKNKRLINENMAKSMGAYGTVYAVDVQIPGRDGTYPFVLKELHQPSTEAVDNHRRGKAAGLNVWNTYRMEDDGKSILMSAGDREGWKVVGDKNELSEEERSDFLPISNFDTFLAKYYDDSVKAANEKIAIAGDVPFFLVRGQEIDFVLGDMDLLEKSDDNVIHILRQNVQNMHSRLVQFLEKNCDKDKLEEYVDQSEKYVQERFKQSVKRYGGDANDGI